MNLSNATNEALKVESQSRRFISVPVPYTLLLALAALFVSVMGAIFSITGLAKLFSGAPVAVMLMAGCLEFAKLISAGFLHHNWKLLDAMLKVYLTIAVIALMSITSLGIFGYLSNAYQKSSVELANTDIKLEAFRDEQLRVANELNRLQKVIDDIPANRITKRMQFQKDAEPEIKNLSSRQIEIAQSVSALLIQKKALQAEIGPLVYVAETFHVGMDVVAKWFILVFVSVFDPLAICLVFAVSFSLRQKQPPAGQLQIKKPTIKKSATTVISDDLKQEEQVNDEALAPRRRRRRKRRRKKE